MRDASFEMLEPRWLLAGVTMLVTGRLGHLIGDWPQAMADAFTTRLGGPSRVAEYFLHVNPDPNDGHLVATSEHVAGTATIPTAGSGETILYLDYYSVSATTNYTLSQIGQAIANFMVTTPVDGVRFAELPIHEIGLSRGSGVIDETSKYLGKFGVWVDQQTYLDPHPIPEQPDPPPIIYDNVAFVDNYWRADNNPNTSDGQPVDGAYNFNAYWLDTEDAGYDSPHVVPAGYYEGTVDFNATTSNRGPIYSSWYNVPPDKPARDQTGYIYTNLAGASRPASGVWGASHGTGTRTATGQQGVQWPDVTDLAITSGSPIFSGQTIQFSYIRQDRDSADTITLFLDSDRNPYNAFAANLGSNSLAQANAITASAGTRSTQGVAAGTYWLCAKISDGQGNARFAYNPITAPINVINTTIPRTLLVRPLATAVGGGTYQFSVDYVDNVNVNASTIGNGDLIVSGPNGYHQSATLVTTGLSNGTALTATYSVNAPSGTWKPSDDGSYTITLQLNQVSDVSNRFFPSGRLGNFSVNVPSISGSQAAAAPTGYNLTTLGTGDWAHWGRGGSAGAFDHKSTGGSQISNVTTVGAGSNTGGYFINERASTWTDGTPTSAATNEHGYIWSNGALNTGYSFTVPADTTTRTLYVYSGGNGVGMSLTAHLSDGSAVDYVATASGSSFYTKLFTITFNAASANQTLKITLLKTQNITGTDGSVDLIGAALAPSKRRLLTPDPRVPVQ